MFFGCTVLLDSKETKFGKNSGVVLVSCCTLDYAPRAISGGVVISEFPSCHSFVMTDEFSVRVTKINARIGAN